MELSRIGEKLRKFGTEVQAANNLSRTDSTDSNICEI